jgi:UDP-N-acetyl-D-glucosamine dehydrogenase
VDRGRRWGRQGAQGSVVKNQVAIFGQGYVGLSVGIAAAQAGHHVVGIDTDKERVAALSRGEAVVPGVLDADVTAGFETGLMRFTTDAAACAEADVVLICVPTPVHEHRPDLAAVEAAGRAAAAHLKTGALVILESTTFAGTTDMVLREILEVDGRVAGRDFLLAFSPERIDPGNTKFSFRDVPRVVGGIDEASTKAAVAFYEQLVDHVHPVSSTRAAELAKLLENTFRMVNIALVNELAMLCADQGISPWEVIEAADTKPFGFMPFYPGPGVGGHCIPIDPTYLTWQSRRDTGRPYRLVEMAQDINASMPAYVADRIAAALNDHSKAVRGSKIVCLGVTYKPDVGDIRESAAIHVMEQLALRGADLAFHDPFIEAVTHGRLDLTRSDLTDALIAEADVVALLTPHASYDLDSLLLDARLVFDARNATRGRRDNVVVL